VIPRPGDAELIRIQLRTLFRMNSAAELVATNEPRENQPPRIFIGRGGGETIIHARAGLNPRVLWDCMACADDAAIRAAVAAHAPVTNEYRGPAFLLPPQPPTHDETLVPVTSRTRLHSSLVARGWKTDEPEPYLGVVLDDCVVSVCYSARSSSEAAEAGVETAPEYRGRGLAVRAVGAWAAAVQATGRLALYSTEWANEGSRRVAAGLAAWEYGEDWHLT